MSSPQPTSPASPSFPASIPPITHVPFESPSSASTDFDSSPKSLPPGKPIRITRPPLWLNDYVTIVSTTTSTGKEILYPLSDSLSFNRVSHSYHAYLTHLDSYKEPSSYQEAILDPRWITAMKEEVSALESNDTWDVVSAPPGKVLISCK